MSMHVLVFEQLQQQMESQKVQLYKVSLWFQKRSQTQFQDNLTYSAFVGLAYEALWPGPGLGPSPGWGPVRVGAHMGPPGQVRTWPNQDFWSNLVRLGSRNGILTKWHHDSASFLLEKLKNYVILTKNLNILTNNPENIRKIPKNTKKS